MLNILWWAGGALVAAIGAAIAVSLWNEVRDAIARWLRDHGLAESALMGGFIRFEKVMNQAVRMSATIRTRQYGQTMVITDRQVSPSEINDSEIRASLERNGHATVDLLTVLQSN